MSHRPPLDPDVATAKAELRRALEATGLPETTIWQLSSAIAKYGATIARSERRKAGQVTGETPAARFDPVDAIKKAFTR